MTTRNPLVLVTGTIQELPAGDTVAGASSIARTAATNITLGANTCLLIVGDYEISSGFVLELAADAVVEIT